MRGCPICHTQYDDSLIFYTKDGHQLNSIETFHAETQMQENRQINQPREKKKIIIVCIIGVIGLIALYYISN